MIVPAIDHKFLLSTRLFISATTNDILNVMRELHDLRIHILVLNSDHLDGIDRGLSPNEVILEEATVDKGLL